MKGLMISNEEMNDIMNILKCLEDFSLLMKRCWNEKKNTKSGFLGIILSTSAATALGIHLASKAVTRLDHEAIPTGDGTIREEHNF